MFKATPQSRHSRNSRPLGLWSPRRRIATLGVMRWFEPVDAASLVAFRIAFGILMSVDVLRYFLHGWIERYYIFPTFHFTYFGFGWVRPWAGPGMYVHFAALGILALFIAAGIWYRASAALFFLGFAHVFLLEQAHYLNHFYLICLLSFLLVFLPAQRAFSVEVWRRPEIQSDVVPAWSVNLLRAQIGIPYFYAGIQNSTLIGSLAIRCAAGSQPRVIFQSSDRCSSTNQSRRSSRSARCCSTCLWCLSFSGIEPDQWHSGWLCCFTR